MVDEQVWEAHWLATSNQFLVLSQLLIIESVTLVAISLHRPINDLNRWTRFQLLYRVVVVKRLLRLDGIVVQLIQRPVNQMHVIRRPSGETRFLVEFFWHFFKLNSIILVPFQRILFFLFLFFLFKLERIMIWTYLLLLVQLCNSLIFIDLFSVVYPVFAWRCWRFWMTSCHLF